MAAQAQTSRFKGSEFENMAYTYTVEAKTPYDALFEPAYWAHVASERRIQPHDEIKVRPDEGNYRAVLLVIEATGHYIRVAELSYKDLTKARLSAPITKSNGAFVEFNMHDKWRVIRPGKKPGDANAVLKDNLSTEADAYSWLLANSKLAA